MYINGIIVIVVLQTYIQIYKSIQIVFFRSKHPVHLYSNVVVNH